MLHSCDLLSIVVEAGCRRFSLRQRETVAFSRQKFDWLHTLWHCLCLNVKETRIPMLVTCQKNIWSTRTKLDVTKLSRMCVGPKSLAKTLFLCRKVNFVRRPRSSVKAKGLLEGEKTAWEPTYDANSWCYKKNDEMRKGKMGRKRKEGGGGALARFSTKSTSRGRKAHMFICTNWTTVVNDRLTAKLQQIIWLSSLQEATNCRCLLQARSFTQASCPRQDMARTPLEQCQICKKPIFCQTPLSIWKSWHWIFNALNRAERQYQWQSKMIPCVFILINLGLVMAWLRNIIPLTVFPDLLRKAAGNTTSNNIWKLSTQENWVIQWLSEILGQL